jgi:uncharacterized protein YpmB
MDTINQMNSQMNAPMSQMPQAEQPSKGSGFRIAIAVIVVAIIVIAAVFLYGSTNEAVPVPVNEQAAIQPAQQQAQVVEPTTAELQADLDAATLIDTSADLKAIDSQF